jgi:hypothetical protein
MDGKCLVVHKQCFHLLSVCRFIPSPTIRLPGYSFFIHSIDVQNVTNPCHSQELLPFLSVIYFFLQLFFTNYSSILPYYFLPSISWSTSQSCFFSKFIYNTLLGILFSSILCTCPNHHNLCNLLVSVMVGFLTVVLLLSFVKYTLYLACINYVSTYYPWCHWKFLLT